MNRNLFLKVCSGVCAALVSGSAWLTVLQKLLKGLSYSELPEDIKALYHQDFARALPALSLEDLFAELTRRGIYVYGWREFHVSQIRANAVSDSLVEFNNFLYTESELLLYAMVARLHEARSVFLE